LRLLLVTVLLAWAGRLCGADAAPRWEPTGLSGGGAMFSPAISPADPKLMMIHCDMSAAYLSRDGGRTWRMIPTTVLGSNTRCRPAFHPTDRQVIYSASGWHGRLMVSKDGGESWTPLGDLKAALCGEISLDPGNPNLLMVGTDAGPFRSTNGGLNWQPCAGVKGAPLGFHFDQTSPPERRTCLAATSEGVWRSDDGGATWAEKSAGLPWRGLRGFGGGSNAKDRSIILYCTIPSKEEGGKFAGGVFRSVDRGEKWESALGAGLNTETKAFDQWAMGPIAQYHAVLTTNLRPQTVWTFNSNTGIPPPHHASAYRSDDAGKTWRATFHPDPRWKPFNLAYYYVMNNDGQFYQDVPRTAIDPSNSEHLMAVDDGRCFITEDGGKTWFCGHTQLAPGQTAPGKDLKWLCNGLVVTSTWNYYLDPFEPQRRYICYTDIGFARSLDAGRTWLWWASAGRAPWRNTCYELAFDPETPGKVWGAFSNVHDIPNGNIICNRHRSESAGGLCVSTDFAASWKPLADGLPIAPATGVVVDPKSPKGRRILYAGFFGKGVFKSTDDGRTWSAANAGLGAPSNLRVCRVQLHPDGAVFALVTALVKGRDFQPEGVGLYRSTDGGESWQLITKTQPLLWPKDFTVDPKDRRVIYVGACDANGKQDGGLYRTNDGGATWSRLARQGPEHFGAYLHPKRPGWIYMTLCEGAPRGGLWLSKDQGATFAPLKAIPFNNCMRVTFDPRDEKVIYVTTFGGSVWKGLAE
jgi:hypothetical protein